MEGAEDFEGVSRAFWAVELVPGKEYKTVVPFDLHITQAVLPASANDKARSVVSIKFEDDDEEEAKSIAIASLKLDSHENQSLDTLVDSDSTVIFSVSGKNPVHLSGYYVPDSNDDDEGGLYGDSEIDSDEFGSEGEGEDEDDVDEDELDEEDIKKANAAIAAQIAAKRKPATQNGGDAKKAKVDAPQQPKQQQQQQQPKQEKKPQQQEGKKQQQQQQQQKGGEQQKKVFSNGLQAIITREGTGNEATKGRRVSVKYVGKLTKSGKVFDSSTGKPFVFTLGARAVITGWDLGVAGMKVGEKRTLIIPPELGYGKEGAGREIPPNSSLTFDVELVNVR